MSPHARTPVPFCGDDGLTMRLQFSSRFFSCIGRRIPSPLIEPPIHFLGGARVGWVGLEFFFKGLGLSNPGCKRRSSRPSFGGASVRWLGAKPYAPGSGPHARTPVPFCGDDGLTMRLQFRFK